MNIDKILEIVSYTLPSLITGGVAYFLFTSYFKDQQNTRRWLLMRENQKESLPLRLQAYERMVLFLERIHPAIYITNECWDVINKSKTTTVQLIRNTSINTEIANASQLREAVLRELIEMEAPSSVAINFLKEELKNIL